MCENIADLAHYNFCKMPFRLCLCATKTDYYGKLIGREIEQQKLSKYMQSESGEFIAIYGRRRVGKTFLVRSFFKDKVAFYATGIIEGKREEEMEAFYNGLKEYGYEGDQRRRGWQCFQLCPNYCRRSRSELRSVWLSLSTSCHVSIPNGRASSMPLTISGIAKVRGWTM